MGLLYALGAIDLLDVSAGGVAMNNALMFSKASDEWSTPHACFDALDAEFHFWIDVAASHDNRKCDVYIGLDHENTNCRDALMANWSWILGDLLSLRACWMNPPYLQCKAFIAKAARESKRGCTVVALVPCRTDTLWWHEHVWDAQQHRMRPGVEVRFVKGRLKFGDSQNSAPFPSVVIVFRPA